MRYVVIEGGSGDHLRGAEYTGQLSVHHADLTLEGAALKGASAKDALSVRHGRVVIRDARFVDNETDGVDLDHSEGSIRGSLFAGGQRGDGIELSGSDVSIADSIFDRDDGRCLNASEGATVRLRGSLFRGCSVGVTSRDAARVELSQSVLHTNARGFAATRRNEVFGGGHILAEDLILVDTGAEERLDDGSQIEVERVIRVGAAEFPSLLDPLATTDAFSAQSYRTLRQALRHVSR
jgi:nitrous oxidase accessory protein NosD